MYFSTWGAKNHVTGGLEMHAQADVIMGLYGVDATIIIFVFVLYLYCIV